MLLFDNVLKKKMAPHYGLNLFLLCMTDEIKEHRAGTLGVFTTMKVCGIDSIQEDCEMYFPFFPPSSQHANNRNLASN